MTVLWVLRFALLLPTLALALVAFARFGGPPSVRAPHPPPPPELPTHLAGDEQGLAKRAFSPLVNVLIGVLIIVACVVLTTTAAALALGRPHVKRLDTDTASKLAADYSADPRGIVLAPLDPDIVEAAVQDDAALAEPAAEPDRVEVDHAPTPTPPAAATDVPTTEPLAATRTSTPEPTEEPTTRPAVIVPTATATHVPPAPPAATVTAQPTSTPRPTNTPRPPATATARPTNTPRPPTATAPQPTATPRPPTPTAAPVATPTRPPDTPEPSATAAPTETPRATEAPTSTATLVRTATPTSVPTVTPTPVPNVSPTPVATVAPTTLPTATPTSFVTPVPTVAVTPTSTETAVDTPTPTATAVDTPTPTATTVDTSTPIPTGTSAPAATETPTPVPGVKILVEPADQKVSLGDTATVDIAVENAVDLGSYSFTLEWTPGLLSFGAVSNSTFLGSTGRTVVCAPPILLSGSVTFGCTSIGLQAGPSGSAALATITFGTAGVGTSALTFADATFTTTSGGVPAVIADGGSVTVSAVTPTPAVTTVTLGASRDAPVWESNPASNFGTHPHLNVDADESQVRRSFLAFDLSSIPAGSTVKAASLTLCFSTDPSADAVGNTHELRKVEEDWMELTITWINQPSVDAITDTIVVPTTGCVTFQVAQDVQDWLDGDDNNGWRISDDREGSPAPSSTQYVSRDNGSSTAWPLLTVTYEAP